MKFIKPYFKSEDLRGEILGIAQFDWIKEMNYIQSKAGSIRGGHYHKQTTELFFIIDGLIHVTISNLQGDVQKSVDVSKGDIFIVDPFEVHTFQVLKDSRWLNALSCPMDAKNPDFFYVSTPTQANAY